MLGAWLRVWTPPRDVELPSIRPRAVALAFLALGVGAAAAAAILVPRIDDAKERGAEAERRHRAAVEERERRRLAREQRVRRGRIQSLRDPLVDVRAAIRRDARARVRRGELAGPIRGVTCRPYPPRAVGRYSCTAVRDYVHSGARRGVLGHPFWAKVDRPRRTFAWCKVNPRPGERSAGEELAAVPPPRACDVRY